MPEARIPDDSVEFGAASALDLMLEAAQAGSSLAGVLAGSVRRRQEAWNRRLREALIRVRDAIGEEAFAGLARDDRFLNLLLEAHQIAARSHEEEKRAALCHAVANAGLPGAPPAELQPLFLRLVDYFSPLHLGVLRLLDDPARWLAAQGMDTMRWRAGSACAVLEACFPALGGHGGLPELIVRDLQNAGLVQQGSFLHIAFTGDGVLQPRTTDTGRVMVRFISPPPGPSVTV